MKKTLIDLDLSLLKDYSAFEKVNKDWSVLSYLNFKYDCNSALSFSKLYFPDFIETKGCTVLSFLYNAKTFEDWFKELDGDVQEVEKMCNLYELKDYFHINASDEDNLDALGEVLKKSWELNLKLLYPDRRFKVNIFDKYDSKFITLHSLSRDQVM